MKKIMMMAAMCAALVAGFSSCEKEPAKGGEGDTPAPEENVFESKITIDGDFEDWDALDATKVASATCAEGARYTALKSFKVYADKMFINILVEWDTAQIGDIYTPFHVYINGDNSDKTGGYDGFVDKNCDAMMEGPILDDMGEIFSFDPSYFKWWGEVGYNGWDGWTDPSTTHSAADNWGALIPQGSGVAQGAGYKGKYEIQIIRELLTETQFAPTFGIGIDIQQNWQTAGVLPNSKSTEGNPHGRAKKLKVTIDE